jgi:hypothetical protein
MGRPFESNSGISGIECNSPFPLSPVTAPDSASRISQEKDRVKKKPSFEGLDLLPANRRFYSTRAFITSSR